MYVNVCGDVYEDVCVYPSLCHPVEQHFLYVYVCWGVCKYVDVCVGMHVYTCEKDLPACICLYIWHAYVYMVCVLMCVRSMHVCINWCMHVWMCA